MKENKQNSNQPGLFEPQTSFNAGDVVLFALGDFQDRGFKLVGREIALDRLLGAFTRAFEIFDIVHLSDSQIASTLQELGADVKELPAFVAKHPFRISIDEELAKKAVSFFSEFVEKEG